MTVREQRRARVLNRILMGELTMAEGSAGLVRVEVHVGLDGSVVAFGSIPFSVLDHAHEPTTAPGGPGCRSQAQDCNRPLVDGCAFRLIRQEVADRHAHLCQICA